ncbi:MAG: HAMP domain-containing sensor histidine kinase, partial [Deltaproteobacteria bacterium]|nr:HAMP domain-containing sensor histidine kinase [Deltaproteobacteria bacterium]
EREKLFQEQRSFSKLATQVVHDLRSPLSSLKTAHGYFTENCKDPQMTKAIELLGLGTERLLAISEELLTKYKKNPDVVSAESNTSVHQILDGLVKEYEMQKQYEQIKFIKDFAVDAVSIAKKNAVKLQRVVGNLIKNAVEAMNNAGILVLQATMPNEQELLICVTDNGPGMSPETLKKVMNGNFSGKQDGHGIGLTAARETIESFAGRFSIDSAPGRGTSITLHLPLASLAKL